MSRKIYLLALVAALPALAWLGGHQLLGVAEPAKTEAKPDAKGKVVRTDAQWRKLLTREQYRIMRQKGTERAFTGKSWNNHEAGIYRCAGCGQPLFSSKTKYDSGTGWPSFWSPIDPKNIAAEADKSYGMVRTEVLCSRCESHLGHVFEDGPKPTGLRYCINSAALDFVPDKPAKKDAARK